MFVSGAGNEPIIFAAGRQNFHECRGVRDGHAAARGERASAKKRRSGRVKWIFWQFDKRLVDQRATETTCTTFFKVLLSLFQVIIIIILEDLDLTFF